MLKLDSCARDCRDDLILKRSGRDAIQYLKFQRYLLAYMGIITILSIGVILLPRHARVCGQGAGGPAP